MSDAESTNNDLSKNYSLTETVISNKVSVGEDILRIRQQMDLSSASHKFKFYLFEAYYSKLVIFKKLKSQHVRIR